MAGNHFICCSLAASVFVGVCVHINLVPFLYVFHNVCCLFLFFTVRFCACHILYLLKVYEISDFLQFPPLSPMEKNSLWTYFCCLSTDLSKFVCLLEVSCFILLCIFSLLKEYELCKLFTSATQIAFHPPWHSRPASSLGLISTSRTAIPPFFLFSSCSTVNIKYTWN